MPLPPRQFYAVAEYSTASPEAAEALAARLTAKGCDDLQPDHPQHVVKASYGPFLSSADDVTVLAADARLVFLRLAEGSTGSGRARPYGVPEVLNATAADGGTLVDLTDVPDLAPSIGVSARSIRSGTLLLDAIKKHQSRGWSESESDLRAARRSVLELDDDGLKDVRQGLIDLRDRNEDVRGDEDPETRREIGWISNELAQREMHRDSEWIEQRLAEIEGYAARVRRGSTAATDRPPSTASGDVTREPGPHHHVTPSGVSA